MGSDWLNIKWIQDRKESELSIFVNYGFDPNEFKDNKLVQRRSRSQRKPRKDYKEKLPISAAKKADLLSLVASGTIPQEYESYYQSLPCSKSVKGKLPVPSDSECDDCC